MIWKSCILFISFTALFNSTSNGENVSEVSSPIVDEITLKQKEMRDTIILVKTRQGNGSGTIMDRLDTEIEGVFEYRVLTNKHVTHLRFVRSLKEVNSLTGKIKVEIADTGCMVVVFDHLNEDWDEYDASVVAESIEYDFAILSFLSNDELAIAKIANTNMLEQIRVFDKIFTIGCQLGRVPIPTTGIISQILTGRYGEREWIIYGNTAQIAPGSSGGGLFKKYDDHYYLIGIPFRLATHKGKIILHLSHAISIITARDFIDRNCVSK